MSISMRTDLALDALEQANHARRDLDDLVHHGDRGCLSNRHTERLVEAGIERSVGSVGDSHGNALAVSVIGLHETELIRQQDLGAAPRTTSSSPRSSTSTCSTTDACSNRSATCRPLGASGRTMPLSKPSRLAS